MIFRSARLRSPMKLRVATRGVQGRRINGRNPVSISIIVSVTRGLPGSHGLLPAPLSHFPVPLSFPSAGPTVHASPRASPALAHPASLLPFPSVLQLPWLP